MGSLSWIRRLFTVWAGTFLFLAGVAALRGHSPREAVAHGFLWGAITALIFTGSRRYESREGRRCALCADTPEPHKP